MNKLKYRNKPCYVNLTSLEISPYKTKVEPPERFACLAVNNTDNTQQHFQWFQSQLEAQTFVAISSWIREITTKVIPVYPILVKSKRK